MGAKVKTIKQVIRTKIEDWCSSIDDEDLVRAIKRDAIVTGGSITSMLLGERINDFDIYFRTKETTRKVAEYYVGLFIANKKPHQRDPVVRDVDIVNIKGETENVIQIHVESAGIAQNENEYDGYDYEGNGEIEESMAEILNSNSIKVEEASEEEKKPYRVVFMSQSAITLSDQIQIVIRFFGNPEEIHRSFDFTHAKCWYSYANNHLETPVDALQCILARNLHYSGSLYPIASLFRAKKFIQRGWKCSAGELVKIAWQISEINMNDIDTLKSQLTGVDLLYMHALVSAIEDWKKTNNDEDISQNYVTEIIDRVFS